MNMAPGRHGTQTGHGTRNGNPTGSGFTSTVGYVLAVTWMGGIMVWGVFQSAAQRNEVSADWASSCKASTSLLTAIQLVPYKLRAAQVQEVSQEHQDHCHDSLATRSCALTGSREVRRDSSQYYYLRRCLDAAGARPGGMQRANGQLEGRPCHCTHSHSPRGHAFTAGELA